MKRKGPKYVVGKFKPAAGCCLYPYEPMYCLVWGPRAGTYYVCPLFNGCPVECREKCEDRMERWEGGHYAKKDWREGNNITKNHE